MARNAGLRKMLQQRLGIERAQLYKRAEKLANSLSCSTSDAILVLAQKSGINLKKYGGDLSPEKLKEIRELSTHAAAATTAAAAPMPAASSKGKRRERPKSKRSFRIKVQDGQDDPVLSQKTHNEMEAMVPVYKKLYTLENSIRQFITRVLVAKQGKDWWEKIATSPLKRTYANNSRAEEVNAWHQRRSTNPIDYLDLDQLPALVRAAQSDFVPIFFKSEHWFQQFVEEVYQSRCVVCHMNPLTQNNVDGVGLRFNHWENLVKEKIGEVMKLEEKVAEPPVTASEPAPALPVQAAAVEVPGPTASTSQEVKSEDSSKTPAI